MPTTRPAASARAPPELPGLSAASVWITSSITRPALPDRVGSDRPNPLDHPRGDGSSQPQRVSDSDHELADPQIIRIAEADRASGDLRAGADDRQIGERIGTDDVNLRLGTVGEFGGTGLGIGNHVGIGQEVAVLREQDSGAGGPC